MMKEYAFAGGLTFEALVKNMNYYADQGFTAIPPVIIEKAGRHTAFVILMELQRSDKTGDKDE